MVIRQFDVVRLGRSALAVVLQADLLDETNTCVVAPLLHAAAVIATTRLHPTVEVEGKAYIIATEKLAAVHRRELGATVMSLKESEWDIRRALDLVLVGV